MRLRGLIVTISSLAIAFSGHLLLGLTLIELSEHFYPRQVSSLGMAGVLIVPHPLTGGLFLVPISAVLVGAVLLRIFRKRRWLGFRPVSESNPPLNTDARQETPRAG